MTTRIAVLIGSVRADSVNRQIAETLQRHAPEGIQLDVVTGIESLPFYDEGLDATAPPAGASSVRQQVADADAVLAITPEYNGTMPAVLNNAIDWLSRPYGTGALTGKPFGVIGATPTPFGGKWAHDDAQRSAGIAGAVVVDGAVASQSAIDVDVLNDAEVLERFLAVVRSIAEHRTAAA